MAEAITSDDREKSHYIDSINSVRAKIAVLGTKSHLAMSVPDEVLSRLEDRVRNTPASDLLFGYWPPAYGLIASTSLEDIRSMDDEIHLVIERSDPAKAKELVGFLRASEKEKNGAWYGGMFDIWSKGVVIRSGLPAEFDRPLPNGRDHDIRLELDGVEWSLENTVITQDDESIEVWNHFLVDKRSDPGRALVRPGPYCPPHAKGPSPYYDALRVYAKVFDKIAKNLDPDKSQFAVAEKNLLLLSFSGFGVDALSPAAGWALDELFADQPRGKREGSGTDITLEAWVDITARGLINRGKMDIDFFIERFADIISAPRRLSGIFLFDDKELVGSRVNYNADDASRISHREIAALEDLFRKP